MFCPVVVLFGSVHYCFAEGETGVSFVDLTHEKKGCFDNTSRKALFLFCLLAMAKSLQF